LKYFITIWLAIVASLSGCSFDVTEIQSIDIETYPETEKNVKLSEDLIYYDPRYIAFKVPGFNESTAQGIKLGYFVRSSDGKPVYRITYSMKVPAIAKNIDSLKSDFETYIPKLAATHASKDGLFNMLAPKGQEWAVLLFSRSADDILSTSSSLLRKSINSDQLTAAIQNLTSEYGSPSSTDFVRAQYYEAFSSIPESVSLYYLQTYQNKKKAFVRVSYHQDDGEWVVMGFRIEPHA